LYQKQIEPKLYTRRIHMPSSYECLLWRFITLLTTHSSRCFIQEFREMGKAFSTFQLRFCKTNKLTNMAVLVQFIPNKKISS